MHDDFRDFPHVLGAKKLANVLHIAETAGLMTDLHDLFGRV
jgi:hypothetical protein